MNVKINTLELEFKIKSKLKYRFYGKVFFIG